MKKQLSLILILLLISSLLAGCGNDKESSSTEDHELIYGTTGITASLDPHVDWNGWYTVRYGVGETLFKLNESMEPEPWIAESYENIDQYTWRIRLRDDVCFSNGQKVTAEKVIENLKVAGGVNIRARVLGTAEYDTEDDYTFTIKTEEPFATLINELCDPFSVIMDMENTEDGNNAPVCTGPYTVESFVRDKEVILKKNENYWDGTPGLDTITIKEVADADTLIMALQSGEVDVATDVTADSLSLFSDESEYTISEVSTSRVYMLYYNLGKVTDTAVRKAISLAIDKDTICNDLLNGSATPATAAFPDDTAYGGTDMDRAEYNPEAAKKILADAGYKDSDGDGILEKDGQKLTLEWVLYKRLSQEAIATEIQAELKAIGIEVSIRVYDTSEYLNTGDFDIGMYSIVTNQIGDPESFLNSTMRTGAMSNFGKYSNTDVDSLIDGLLKEFDTEKRARLAVQIQQKALDDYAYEFIGFNNMIMIMKSKVKGLETHPTDYYQINVNTDITN